MTGQDIPGIGDLRIAEPTANHIRRLLATIPAQHLPEPRLAPFSGGGLALILSAGNRELTFTTYPDHNDFVFMLTNENDESINEGILTLNQTERLSDIITAFLIS
jgi:hypothetical protein